MQSEFRLYTFIVDYKVMYNYFCVKLLATRDISSIITQFSCQGQEVKLNIWEIFNKFDILLGGGGRDVNNFNSEFLNIPGHLS